MVRTQIWTGEEWQEEALRLLHFRHRDDSFQLVPDSHGGDLGIEAYTRTGFAFQCYAVQEPVTIAKRYEKQRDKMTEDIGKFIENERALTVLLRGSPIRRWCLVVPFFDSVQLSLHAATKSADVLALGLPYVTNDFAIDIIDEKSLEVEKVALVQKGLGHIDATAASPSDAAVHDWAAGNDELVHNLDDKIARMRGLSAEDRRGFRDLVLRYYVQGQNVRQTLREAYLPLLELVEKAKREKETYLQGQALILPGEPTDVVAQTRWDYLVRLDSEVGGLTPGTREALSWEAIADWLLRCPLDFRENPP